MPQMFRSFQICLYSLRIIDMIFMFGGVSFFALVVLFVWICAIAQCLDIIPRKNSGRPKRFW